MGSAPSSSPGPPLGRPAAPPGAAGRFQEICTGQLLAVPSWRPDPALPAQGSYGRFELLGRLARGGMAEILLARERAAHDTTRHVVVKRLRPRCDQDPDVVRMFVDEARLLMRMSDPHICRVYEFGQQGGTWFIAMEWVKGVALKRLIRRASATGTLLSPTVVARVVASVASALSHAHGLTDDDGTPMGLVHRDVSPHNIMVAYSGTAKLLDFGIAKYNRDRDLTATGVIKGKFAYMAPEQCLGQQVDGRCDIFALGVCLYEALTGVSPFERNSDFETLRSVVQDPVPSVRDLNPAVPEALALIVARTLEKDVSLRYQTARALSTDLLVWLQAVGAVVTDQAVAKLVHGYFPTEKQLGPSLAGIGRAIEGDDAPRADLEEASTQAMVAEPNLEAAAVAPGGAGVGLRQVGLAALALVGVAGLWLAHASLMPTVPTPSPDARLLMDATSAMDLSPGSLGVAEPVGAEPKAAVEAVAEAAREAAPDDPGSGPELADDVERSELAVTPARPTPQEVRPVARHGRLSINTRPWSRVYVGGRLLGTTPLGNLRLRAGDVRMRLVDRDGRVHNRSVRVRPGHNAPRFFELR